MFHSYGNIKVAGFGFCEWPVPDGARTQQRKAPPIERG